MSKGKKYYWLKLKNDFFGRREIKKLRKIAGGDTYTIIYLKMQLLSIQEEGLITFEGTERNLIEQLALELDEDEDNIEITLSFLNANKLIEQLTPDEYLLNQVPETIGSETKAAERMRALRERKKIEEEKRNNVTPELQAVTKSYTEIEIENRDREDIDKNDVIVMNDEEKEYIAVLENIEDYPLDRKKDLKYLKTLKKRYPRLDIIEAVNKFSTYVLDKPFKKNSNHRSQLNSSFAMYVEWETCLKKVTIDDIYTRGIDKY